MKASKADVISGLAKAIQFLQDERDMLDLSCFDTMTEYWKVEDELIASMDNLYMEMRKVLENQDILYYFR